VTRPRCFLELPAGLASVSLRLHGGKHCRPPISRMGNKAGYAEVILDALGLRSGDGADAYLWAEADDDVRGLLRAYPDAAMLTRIAEIIRGWADEEPRALWERLRAERKERATPCRNCWDGGGTVNPVDCPCFSRKRDDVAGWIVTGSWAMRRGQPDSGYTESRTHIGIGEGHGDPPEAMASRCQTLATYAQIAMSNRLIHVGGPALMNTGIGGTTFGGAEFATPAEDVAAGFERLAGWMFDTANAHGGTGGWKVVPSSRPHTDANMSVAGLSDATDRLRSSWPPVAILPRIPRAADVSAWLGTPGDLSGCIAYMDPPYSGTTGYGHDLGREEVIAIARDFDALGAVVCISEAEPVIEGWHATEITGGRRGQKRTFSKQQREWLTMNRAPAATVATQIGMFA
jgi:hypothetical protein